MTAWAEDPELLSTFQAEVEERVASLTAGLLQLETHPAPRQLVASLFRDAHTVKGSARMLGRTEMLQVAHRCEDLLGAIRDGRLSVSRKLIDLMLTACDAMTGSLPGAAEPVSADRVADVVAALERAASGSPVSDPTSAAATANETPREEPADDPRPRGTESVRVVANRVHDLLDTVGEAELETRRVLLATSALDDLAAEHGRWVGTLRESLAAAPSDDDSDQLVALRRLAAVGERLAESTRSLREVVDDAQSRLTQVREEAMSLAMVPVGRIFAALPRVVRDVASVSGKDVRLVTLGDDVELDKQVLDAVSDALKHLVVNAVDHGCETPAARRAAGKPAEATVTVAARAAGGTVVVDVTDDGRGIDEAAVREAAIARGVLPPDTMATGAALLDVLFLPAFSTAGVVTETSGRGVGLDVVRDAVEALGGSVEIRSTPGMGTTFTLSVPVTLGVLRCLLARVGGERYALPLPGIVESISLRGTPVHELAGRPVVVRHDVTIPLLDLAGALGVPQHSAPTTAVVVRQGDRQVAWAVDRLDGELELVVKDLGPFLGRLPAIPGATIDSDGSVVCLVDLRELGEDTAPRTAPTDAVVVRRPLAESVRPRVLVVEDSTGVRELERVVLESAGYDVTTAVDGLDGAARLTGAPVDLVLTDVEMPGMDGFTLTRTIRSTPGWEHVPIVIMTSRGSADDQRAGLDAGASAYLLKTEFTQEELVETVRRLVGREE